MKFAAWLTLLILLTVSAYAQKTVESPINSPNTEKVPNEISFLDTSMNFGKDERILTPFVPFAPTTPYEEPPSSLELYAQSVLLEMIEAEGTYQEEPASLLIVRKLSILENSETESAKGFLQIASLVYALDNVLVTDTEINAMINGNQLSLLKDETSLSGQVNLGTNHTRGDLYLNEVL